MGQRHKGIGLSPSTAKAIFYDLLIDTQNIGPFSRTRGSTIKRNYTITSTISALFNIRRPTAVSWLIISVVINSIYRVF